MLSRLARTLLSAVITLWAIATGTFLLMEWAPGGPASGERRLDPAVEAANLAALGLADLVNAPCDGVFRDLTDDPYELAAGEVAGVIDGNDGTCFATAPVSGEVVTRVASDGDNVRRGQILAAVRHDLLPRYLKMLGAIATLNLGVTYTSRGERTVRENLAESLPVSASIGALALVMALLLGVPSGLLAARRKAAAAAGHRVFDVVTSAAVSVPAIVLGPCLLYLLAIRFPLFPIGGGNGLPSLILPSCTLGLVLAAVIARMTAAGASGFLGSTTAATLRARGIAEHRVAGVHAMRHASIVILGFLPPAVASLLTGSVVVESVFNVPGVARYLVGAALNRDHPMVLGVVLAYSAILVTSNLAAELLYLAADPRLRGRDPSLHGGTG